MNLLESFKNYLFSQDVEPSRVTVKNYLSDVNHFVKWFEKQYGTFLSSPITNTVLDEYRTEFDKILSPVSMQRHLSSLRKFFKYLKSEGKMTMDPFAQSTIHADKNKDLWRLNDFKNNLFVANAAHLTIKNYIIDVKQFVRWAKEVTGIEDNLLINRLNTEFVEEYKQRLVKDEAYSPATVNRKLSSLRKYLTWAQNEGLLTQNLSTIENINEAKEKLYIPSADSLDQIQLGTIENIKEYSKFPPLRLVQKFSGLGVLSFDALFTAPLVKIATKTQEMVWKIKGQPIFEKGPQTLVTKNITAHDLLGIKNISKQLYAPFKLSIDNYSPLQKLIFHTRYTRPNWYKTYHSYAITHYFHFAVLVIFLAAIGFGIYNSFFIKPSNQNPALAALPTAPPRILSFQGRLTDENDNPITANTNIRFAIYDDLSASGGALLWQEVNQVLPDTDGIFNSILGNNTTIPSTLFSENSALYLGVTIETTPELTPRQQLATVAYAANSETLQGLVPITGVGAGTNNVVLALDSSGNLTIGGSANPVFTASGGQFKLSGQPLLLTTNVGTDANVQITTDDLGKLDFQKPILNSTNNNNIQTAQGAVEVNDLFAILATSSGQSAFTINQTSTGPIISASSGGTARFTVDNSGNTTIAGNVTASGGTTSLNNGTSNLINFGANGVAVPSSDTTAGWKLKLYDSPTTNEDFGIGIGSNEFWNRIGGAASNNHFSWYWGTTEIAQLTSGGNLQLDGSLTLSPLTTNGGLLYTSGTGVVSQITSQGTSGTDCLVSQGAGAAPIFTSCAGGAASSIFWNQTNGALYPKNSTVDFLVGGQATTSALFSFTGVSSLTNQTKASISGQLIVMPNNGFGNVGIGTTNPEVPLHLFVGESGMAIPQSVGAQFTVEANTTAGISILTPTASGSYINFGNPNDGRGSGIFRPAASANSLGFYAGNLSEKMRLLQTGSLGIGTTVPTATLDVRGNSGTTPVASLSGQTSFAALVVDNKGVGDIFTASSSGLNRFVITQGGNVGIGTTDPTSKLEVNGNIELTTSTNQLIFGTTNDVTLQGGSNDLFLTSGHFNAEFGVWGRSIVARQYGFDAPTAGILNWYNTANVVASVSATSAFVLSSTTPTIQSTAGQTLTLGGTTTGVINVNNKAGSAFTTFDTVNSRVGIGTTGPSSKLEVYSGDLRIVTPDSSTDQYLLFEEAGGEVGVQLKYVSTGNELQINDFSTGNNVATFERAGNVGIGTTNPATSLNLGSDTGTTVVGIQLGTSNPVNIYKSAANQLTIAGLSTGGSVSILGSGSTGSQISFNAAGTSIANNGGSNELMQFNVPTSGSYFFNINSSAKVKIDSSGNVGIGTTTPTALLHVDGGYSNNAALIVNNLNSGDLFTASASGVSKFTVSNTGALTSAAYTNAGGILYTSASGLIGQTSVGTAIQCLIGGTIPTWGSCEAGGATTDAFWGQSNGALFANNSTVDLLIGGQATTSAKFAFLNVAGGTPTASISANSGNIATYLTGAGNLQTTNMQTLTIGGATTGNINLTPGNGSVSSYVTVTNGELILGGSNSEVRSTGNLYVRGAGNIYIQPNTASSPSITVLNSNNYVGMGTTTPTARLDVVGTASVGGQLTFRSGSGTIQTTAGETLTLGGTTTGLININNKAGTAFTTFDTVNSRVGIGTAVPSAKLEINNGTTSDQLRISDDNSAGNYFKIGRNTTTGSLDIQGTQVGANNIALAPTSGNVGIGTTAPLAKLSVGTAGIADANLPVQISAVATNMAYYGANRNDGTYGMIVGWDSNYGATVRSVGATDPLSFLTASATRAMTILYGGNVGIGTISPDARLEINHATGDSLRLTYNDSDGSASNYTDFSLASDGDLTINSSGGMINFSDAVTFANDAWNNSAEGTGRFYFGSSSSTYIKGAGIVLRGTGDTNLITMNNEGRLGIGLNNGSPLASLDVKANTGTIPIASISGATSFASLVVDNSGVGDLFTASKSGATKLTLTNSGVLNVIGDLNDGTADLRFTGTGGSGGIGAASGQLRVYRPDGNLSLILDDTNFEVYSGTFGVGTTSQFAVNTLGAITASTGVTLTSGGFTLGASLGTASQCLLGGTTASWGTCATGAQTTDAFWGQSQGALYPNNSTVDFLIGGQSTASAKFSFTGLSSLTNQTQASISGQLIVMPNNGYSGKVGIGTTAPDSHLQILTNNGNVPAVIHLKAGSGQDTYIRSMYNGTDTEFNSAYGMRLTTTIASTNLLLLPTGNVGIGNTSPLTALDVTGSASLSANLSFRGAATAHTFNILGNGTLNIQRSPGGDAGLTTALFVQNNGNVGIGTTGPGQKLTVSGGIIGEYLASGDNPALYAGTGDTSNTYARLYNTSGTTDFGQGNGTSFINTNSQNLTISGPTTITSTSTTSFDTSSSLTLGTTTLTLDSNSTINGGAAANDDLTLQGTSNGTRTTSYVILQPTAGNVGIGTTTPAQSLDVNGKVIVAGTNAGTAGLMFGSTSFGFGGTNNGVFDIIANTKSKLKFISNTTDARIDLRETRIISNGVANSSISLEADGTGSVLFATNANSGGGQQAQVTHTASAVNYLSFTGAATTANPAISVLGSDTNIGLKIDGKGTGNILLNSVGTGNVGIGTTGPRATLSLGSGTSKKLLTYDNAANLQSGIGVDLSGNSREMSIFAGDDGTTGVNGGHISFGLMTNATTYTEYMRLAQSGYVGIGTTSPGQKLEVVGDARLGVGAGLSNDYGKSLYFSVDTTPTDVAGIRMKEHTTDNYGLEFQTYSGGSLSTKMTILGSGNVGIGTTGPTTALEVSGQIKTNAATYSRIEHAVSGVNQWTTGTRDTNDYYIYRETGATNVLIPNGYVGIGTTSPNQKLTLRTGTLRLDNSDFSAGSVGTFLDTSLGATSGNTYASIQNWNSGGSAGGNIALNPTAGNVGIGTTTPTQEKLVVSGGNILVGPLTSNYISFYNSSYKITASSGLELHTGDYIRFLTASSTERMRLAATGLLGLGTTTPISELHVTRALSTGTTGKALAIFDQIENQDIFSASASGVAKFTVTRAGGISLGANGLAYGTSSQCLLGGATASWGTCATGAQTTDAFWNQTAGALHPNNSTVDFLIGGQSTASAKFAFINVNSGTPTLSIPAGNLNVYSDDVSTANIGRSSSQNIGIGGTSGGNYLTSYSATNNGKTLIINSTSDESNSALSAGANGIGFQIRGGYAMAIDDSADLRIYNNVDIDDTLNVDGAITGGSTASISGTLTLGGSSGIIRPATGDLSLQYKSGANAWATAMTIDDVTGNVGIKTTGPSEELQVVGSAKFGSKTDDQFVIVDGIGSGKDYGYKIRDNRIYTNTSWSGTLVLEAQDKMQVDVNADTSVLTAMTILDTGKVGIGDTSPDAFLEVLGTTEQLRLTYTDGTVDSRFTVASNGNLTIDGSTDGTGSETLTLTGYSTLTASTLTNFTTAAALTLGGATSLSTSITSLTTGAAFTINGTSYVRIGDTNSPGVYSGDDDLYVEGDVEIDGDVVIGANADARADVTIRNNGTSYSSGDPSDARRNLALTQNTASAVNILTLRNLANSKFVDILENNGSLSINEYGPAAAYNTNAYFQSGGNIGLGTTSPTSQLYVTRDITSRSATGKALAIFDQIENQDIFSASASGVAKFTVTRAGGISLGANGLAVGTSNQCILSGGAGAAATWGSCVSGITADSLDFDDFVDSMTVDAATDINLGANALSIDLDSTGDFSIRDVTTDIATFADSGAITFAPTSGQSLAINLGGAGDFVVNTDDLYVDTSTGNVGIGTTGPRATLSLGSGTSKKLLTYDNAANLQSGIGVDLSGNSREMSIFAGDDGTTGVNGGHISFGLMTNATTYTEYMRLAQSGYVGIGTTTPTAKFEVAGTSGAGGTGDFITNLQGGSLTESDLYVLNSRDVNTGVGYAAKVIGVNIQNAVGAANQVYLRSNNGGVTSAGAIYMGADDVNQGIFGVMGTPVTSAPGTALTHFLTVKGTGYVGIGTTAPGNKLDIAVTNGTGIKLTGNTANHSLTLNSTDNGGSYYFSFTPGTANNSPVFFYGATSGSSNVLAVRNNGGSFNYMNFYHDDTNGNITTSSTTDLVLNPGGGNVIFSNGDTFAIGGAAATAYNFIADSTATNANAVGDNDLYIEDDLEVDGTIYGNVIGSLDTTFTQGSVVFAGASGVLAEDNASLFFDDTNNRLGVGTAVPAVKSQVGLEVADDNGYTYDTNSLMVVHQTPTATAVLNDPKTTLMLARQGTSGQAYGAAAAFNLSRFENSGVNSRTRLDISLANASFDVTTNNIMTLLSSGNVGIGTTAPSGKLHVISDNAYNDGGGFRLQSNTSGTGNLLFASTSNAGDYAAVQSYKDTVGAKPLLLNGMGGVVIAGGFNSTAGLGADARFQVHGPAATDTAIGIWQNGVFSGKLGSLASDNNFYISNTSADGVMSAAHGITITSGYNVGIGMVPGNKLDVAGTIYASGSVLAGANAVLCTGCAAGYYQDSANGAYRAINNGATNGYYFQSYNGASTSMYVGLYGTYAGKVGIGTAAPGYNLENTGNLNNQGQAWYSYGNTSAAGYSWVNAALTTNSIEIVNGNSVVTNTSPTLAFHRYGSGGPQFRLDPAGTNVLYLESANASSARSGSAPGGGYFASLNLTTSDANGIYVNTNKVFHAGNDGAGSTLDADLLDGISSAGFGRSFGTLTFASSTTTANFITDLSTQGLLGYGLSSAKATWSYAGNSDITDTGFGDFELAGTSLLTWNDGSYRTILAIRPTTGSGGGQVLIYNDQGAGYSPGWRQIWTSTTDGAGSTLDADLLDGITSASFLRSDTGTSWTGSAGGPFYVYQTAGSLGSTAGSVNTLQIQNATAATDAFITFHVSGDYAAHFGLDGTTNDLFYGGWSVGAVKNKVWHAGNDGAGSTLDADLLDGLNQTSANTASTIVARDGSGNFSAGTITAALSGNAATADRVNGYGAIDVHVGTGMRAFYNWGGTGCGGAAPSAGCYTNGISVGSHPGDQAYGFEIAQNMWNDNLWTKSYASGYGTWRLLLNDVNYNSYAPTLTGTGASGNWAINSNGLYGSPNITTGTITSGLINSQTISSAANFTGSLTVANGLTVGKNGGTTSTITFPAQANDPGYISHYESANTARMYFNVSDDAGTTDYFAFGYTAAPETTIIYSGGGMTTTGGLYNGQTITSAANFTGTMTVAGDLEVQGNELNLTNGASPTIMFKDSDNRTGYWHMNSDIMYLLSGANGAGVSGWTQVGGQWPLTINTSNNLVTVGGNLAINGGNITTALTTNSTLTSTGLITANGGVTLGAGDNLTLLSGTGAYTQTFTGTNAHATTITAGSLTTGAALRLVGATSGTALTDGLLQLSGYVGDVDTAGGLISSTATFTTPGGISDSMNLYLNSTNSPSGTFNTVAGILNNITDSTTLANTIYGEYHQITLSGNADKTSYGVTIALTSSSTTADTLRGFNTDVNATGALSSGTRTMMGIRTNPSSTANSSGGTLNMYGAYFNPSSSGGSTGTGNALTTNQYGVYVKSDASYDNNCTAGGCSLNNHGIYVANGTSNTNGNSNKYGLYIADQTGATDNYAAYFGGGTVHSVDLISTDAYINISSWSIDQGGDCSGTARLCFEYSGNSKVSFTTGGQGRFTNGVVTDTPDIAENISVLDQSIESGDIVTSVIYDSTEENVYRKSIASKSDKAYQGEIIGAISENPGFLAAQGNLDELSDDKAWGDDERPLTVAGRIPVKVSTINGDIKTGDSITSSEIPGIGMKATKPGVTLGIAMADYEANKATQSSKLVNGQWQIQNTTCQVNEPDCYNFEKILVFISPSWRDPDVYLTSTGNLMLNNLTPSLGLNQPNSFTLTGPFGLPIDRVGAFAEIAVAQIRAGIINSQQIFTNSLSVATDNVTIAGQSLYSYISAIVSEQLENVGNFNSNNITSPIASIDTLKTGFISPIGEDSKVGIKVNNDKIEIVSGNSATSSAVASFDNKGNATLSGTLTSAGLSVSDDASISGTLRVRRIIADQIEGLDVKAATIAANYITNVTNVYNNSSSSSSAFPTIGASESGQVQYAFDNGSYINIASFSSQLAYVENLSSVNGVFSQNLTAFGTTTLSDTSIVGQLAIGGSLILANNSVNVLGNDLNLQPLRQGGISIMAGLIYIDTNGNVKIGNDVTIEGTLYANNISPINGNDLTFKLSSNSAATNKIAVKGASNSAVLAIDNLGNIIASGAGSFAKLNINSIVGQAYAISPTEVTATGSAGTAKINAGRVEMTINNSLVTDKSLIYITPTSNTQNQVLYLLRQVPSKSFTVGIQTPTTADIPFNWIIVN